MSTGSPATGHPGRIPTLTSSRRDCPLEPAGRVGLSQAVEGASEQRPFDGLLAHVRAFPRPSRAKGSRVSHQDVVGGPRTRHSPLNAFSFATLWGKKKTFFTGFCCIWLNIRVIKTYHGSLAVRSVVGAEQAYSTRSKTRIVYLVVWKVASHTSEADVNGAG